MAAHILKIACDCGITPCERALHAQGDRARRSVSITLTDGPALVMGHIRLRGDSVRMLAAWLLDVPESQLPGYRPKKRANPRKRDNTLGEEVAPWQC